MPEKCPRLILPYTAEIIGGSLLVAVHFQFHAQIISPCLLQRIENSIPIQAIADDPKQGEHALRHSFKPPVGEVELGSSKHARGNHYASFLVQINNRNRLKWPKGPQLNNTVTVKRHPFAKMSGIAVFRTQDFSRFELKPPPFSLQTEGPSLKS